MLRSNPGENGFGPWDLRSMGSLDRRPFSFKAGMKPFRVRELTSLNPRWLVIILAMVIVLACPYSWGEDGRISVFLIGWTHPIGNPFTGYFMRDPLFTFAVEPIPPDIPDSEKQKLDRIYYPRTRQIMIDTYQMIVFNDARLHHFTPRQFHDLDYAFREAGMGSISTFGPAWEQVWEGSTLYDTSPALDYTDEWYHGVFFVRFRRETQPVFTPFVELGMEKVLGDAYHLMVEKPGATVWADMLPRGTPFLISWKPGGSKAGLQWVFTDGFNAQWWGIAGSRGRTGTYGIEGGNPYAIDMATNLLLYSLDRPLISDIYARREARHLLEAFNEEKILILHMMDWADKFGANTVPLTLQLADVEADAAGSVDYYLEQDYQTVIEQMKEISLGISKITAKAVRVKDAALFWVFISEWLIVTGTATLAGLTLWSLMIRKKAYRAVGTTRLETR
jgi:hypothetical protein